MKILELMQGTPEWHAHRATAHNASEAPAMLNVSAYEKRDEFVRRRATGVPREFDARVLALFEEGHLAEALARPLAEQIVGAELYPCVGETDDGYLSASFDGLTADGSIVFEHKLLNAALRSAIDDDHTCEALPTQYKVQMEQQLMVSGADQALFMASDFGPQGELLEQRYCWYLGNAKLRAQIAAGWERFDADVAAYKPTTVPPPAPAPERMEMLNVQVEGRVLASNLDAFRTHAMERIRAINRKLTTDDDFATAEATVKWCAETEKRLADAKRGVLAQMQSVDAVCRVLDDVASEARNVRLDLAKLVKTEKDARKSALIADRVQQVAHAYADGNATLTQKYHVRCDEPVIRATLAESIRGMSSLTSIVSALDAAALALCVNARRECDAVRAAANVIAEFAEHAALFPDAVALCREYAPDALRTLATARVAVAEEQMRAANARSVEAASRTQAAAAPVAQAPTSDGVPAAPTPTTHTFTLRNINNAIYPLTVTNAVLHELGAERADGTPRFTAASLAVALRRASETLLQAAREALEP